MGIMYLYFAVLVLFVPLVRSSACGGSIQANPSKKTLQFPNFPNQYGNDLNCTWTITGVSTKCPCIEFEFFSVPGDANCTNGDWVTVDSGPTAGDGEEGRFCGDLSCGGFESDDFNPFTPICPNATTITLNLQTDSVAQGYGFSLKYYAVTNCLNGNANGSGQSQGNANGQGKGNGKGKGKGKGKGRRK